MRGATILGVLLFAGCTTPAPPQRIAPAAQRAAPVEPAAPAWKETYDQFKNETVSTAEIRMDGNLRYILQVNTPGRSSFNAQSKIVNALEYVTRSWSYLRCNEVLFVVDGNRFAATSVKVDGVVGGGSVTEFLSFGLTHDMARSMAYARDAKGRGCGWVDFTVPQQAQGLLRQLFASASTRQ